MRATTDIFYYTTDGIFIGSNNSANSNNILTNDGYAADCGLNAPNGFGPAMGHITNLIIDQTGLAGNFNISNIGLNSGMITLINSTGDIPIGTYPFSYSFCDSINTTICADGYGWITVLGSARMADIKNDDSIENVTIYPNPSTGLFTLLFPNKIREATVTVFSTLGQELFSDVITQTNEKTINLTSLSSGTYLVQINYGEITENKLIIKK